MPSPRKPKTTAQPSSLNADTDPTVAGLGILRLMKQMATNASASVMRSQYAAALGYGYQGDRDVYTGCGWTKDLQFSQFLAMFTRHPLGQAVISRPVEGCWRTLPEVIETDLKSEETQFEKAWKILTLDKNLKLWNKVRRADLISGIGAYGVIFLGVDSGADLSQPVKRATKLGYMTPLTQQNAEIQTYETDSTSPRYGLPLMYNLTFSSGDKQSKTAQVHWTRVIHVAEGCLENDVFGTPRAQVVFNLLQDIEKATGCSAEAFWLMAFPGLHFDIDKEMDVSQQSISDFKEQIEDYVHKLTRVLRTQGVDVKSLSANSPDPKGLTDALVSLISAGTGIPQRILLGSERGELASSQDAVQWASICEERRSSHINPNILDALIQRLVDFGVLPQPKEGSWTYEWSSLHEPTEAEKIDVAVKKTEAVAKYAAAPGAQDVVPLEFFRRKFLGFTDEDMEEIASMDEERAKELDEEAKQMEADQKTLEAELAAKGGSGTPPPAKPALAPVPAARRGV